MKKIVVFLTLALLSSSAFGFIPKQTDLVVVTKDNIYLKDKKDQYWKTFTDCEYDITKTSEVSILPFEKRWRVKSKVVLRIDGEKHVCRITEMSKL